MIDYQLRAAKALQAGLRKQSGYVPPSKVPKVRYSRLTACPVDAPDLWPIANAIMMEVSNCVPDGDPIDRLAPKLERMGIDRWNITKWLDKAARKFLGVKSYNEYLVDAWESWNEVCEPDQQMENPWR